MGADMKVKPGPEPLMMSSDVPEELRIMAFRINNLLWTFEWKGVGEGETRGEISVDTEHGLPNLILRTYAPDNDSDDGEQKLLVITRPISPLKPPVKQIRDIIHFYLCHEADEQMLFDGVQVFDPHIEDRPAKRPPTHVSTVMRKRIDLGLTHV